MQVGSHYQTSFLSILMKFGTHRKFLKTKSTIVNKFQKFTINYLLEFGAYVLAHFTYTKLQIQNLRWTLATQISTNLQTRLGGQC